VVQGRSAGDTTVMSTPSTNICPLSGCSNPPIRDSSVLLPAPDGPTIDRNAPRSIVRSNNIAMSSYRKARSLTSRCGTATHQTFDDLIEREDQQHQQRSDRRRAAHPISAELVVQQQCQVTQPGIAEQTDADQIAE